MLQTVSAATTPPPPRLVASRASAGLVVDGAWGHVAGVAGLVLQEEQGARGGARLLSTPLSLSPPPTPRLDEEARVGRVVHDGTLLLLPPQRQLCIAVDHAARRASGVGGEDAATLLHESRAASHVELGRAGLHAHASTPQGNVKEGQRRAFLLPRRRPCSRGPTRPAHGVPHALLTGSRTPCSRGPTRPARRPSPGSRGRSAPPGSRSSSPRRSYRRLPHCRASSG